MSGSLLSLPFRLGVRVARVSLHAGRDLADLGLTMLEVVERVLEEPAEEPERPTAPAEAERRAPRAEPRPPSRRPATRVPVRSAPPAPDAASEQSPPPPDAASEQPPAPPSEELAEQPPTPPPDAVPEVPPTPPDQVAEEPTPLTPEAHLPDDRELVEELADPGAAEGAGASLRVAAPFPGYDELRAADVIARLPGVDAAELGATELYERTHRGRRTVLQAIARERRRRPPA